MGEKKQCWGRRNRRERREKGIEGEEKKPKEKQGERHGEKRDRGMGERETEDWRSYFIIIIFQFLK